VPRTPGVQVSERLSVGPAPEKALKQGVSENRQGDYDSLLRYLPVEVEVGRGFRGPPPVGCLGFGGVPLVAGKILQTILMVTTWW